MKRIQSVTLGLLLVVLVGAFLFFGGAKKAQSWETWCPNECKDCSNLGCYGAPTYDDGFCTCYAYQRAVAAGWRPLESIQQLGNAYDWDNRAEAKNLPVGSYPYPGSIEVREWWEGGKHRGHVSYVMEVKYTSGGNIQFRVDEMNPCPPWTDPNTGVESWPCAHCVRQGAVNNTQSPQFQRSFIYPPADKAVLVFPALESIRPEDNPFPLVWYSYNGGPYVLEVRLFTIPYA